MNPEKMMVIKLEVLNLVLLNKFVKFNVVVEFIGVCFVFIEKDSNVLS